MPPPLSQYVEAYGALSHTGGLILYSRSFNPTYEATAKGSSSPLGALFRDVVIEGKKQEQDGFEKDGFSLRWERENGLGLVFVVSS